MEHRLVTGITGHEQHVSEPSDIKLNNDQQGNAILRILSEVTEVELDLVVAVSATEHELSFEAVTKDAGSIDALEAHHLAFAFSDAEERLADRRIQVDLM